MSVKGGRSDLCPLGSSRPAVNAEDSLASILLFFCLSGGLLFAKVDVMVPTWDVFFRHRAATTEVGRCVRAGSAVGYEQKAFGNSILIRQIPSSPTPVFSKIKELRRKPLYVNIGPNLENNFPESEWR